MLDVTKEEPEQVAEDSVSCDPISGSSDRHNRHEPAIMKPYLKFGVSAILGLDIQHRTPSPVDNGSSPLLRPEESPQPLDMKTELFHHIPHIHHHHSSPLVNDHSDTKAQNVTTFHPVYHLHSYFHPLIQQQQQAHSAGKPNYSGIYIYINWFSPIDLIFKKTRL